MLTVMPQVTTGELMEFEVSHGINLPCNVIFESATYGGVVAPICHVSSCSYENTDAITNVVDANHISFFTVHVLIKNTMKSTAIFTNYRTTEDSFLFVVIFSGSGERL